MSESPHSAKEAEAQAWRLRIALHEESLRAQRIESRLAEVLNSRSWRITAPFRALVRRFGASAETVPRPRLRAPEAANCSELPVWADVPPALEGALTCTPGRRLYVDVTQLDLEDLGAGVQRVTRKLLSELVLIAPPGYTVEPIRLASNGRYQSAQRFLRTWLGLGTIDTAMEFDLEPAPGDVFIGLDFLREHVEAAREALVHLRGAGVATVVVAHDTLPVDHPAWFPRRVSEEFEAWLRMTSALAERVVCVSEATRASLSAALAHRSLPAPIHGMGVMRMGADTFHRVDVSRLPPRRANVARICMVGTIEPRKGHEAVLSAFERLWAAGQPVELVVAGRVGWDVEALVERLRSHPQAGRNLFWIEGGDDATISGIYQTSDLLIMASLGEGFGLPIVEAASHGCALMVRDLPVFREVAGDRAIYFSGGPEQIEVALREWLCRPHTQARSTDSVLLPTWEDAANDLILECQMFFCAPSQATRIQD